MQKRLILWIFISLFAFVLNGIAFRDTTTGNSLVQHGQIRTDTEAYLANIFLDSAAPVSLSFQSTRANSDRVRSGSLTPQNASTALLATDVAWINPGGGNWNVAANWTSGVSHFVPVNGDDVFLGNATTGSVTSVTFNVSYA